MGSPVHRLQQDCVVIKDCTRVHDSRIHLTATFRSLISAQNGDNSHATFHYSPHPSTLICNHDAICDPFAISTQSMNKTAGVYRTRNGRWAVSFTDCVRIAAGLHQYHRIRRQLTANFRPGTRSNSYRVPHKRTAILPHREQFKSYIAATTKLKHNPTNPHPILNPFAIPMQSVNMTAGVYRTRAVPWAVLFTDCKFITQSYCNPVTLPHLREKK